MPGEANMEECWERFGELVGECDAKEWPARSRDELKEFADYLRDDCEMDGPDVDASRRMLDAMMRGGNNIEDRSLRRQVRLARISATTGCELVDGYDDYDGRYMFISAASETQYGNCGDDIREMIDVEVSEIDLELDKPVEIRVFDLDRPTGWWDPAFEGEVEMKIVTTWKGRKPDGF